MAKIRVMVVDDHAMLRGGLKLLINAQSDMEVVGEAGAAAEAVRLVKTLSPQVVTLDLTMPGGGGLGVMRAIREAAPAARVLVLTMHDETAYLRTALAQGATGYLVKTAADQELITAIRAVSQDRLFVDMKLRGGVDTLLAREPAGAKAGDGLSERERQVLTLLAQGHTNREAAERLHISTKTVETYRARLAEKLGLGTRADFVRCGREMGLLDDLPG